MTRRTTTDDLFDSFFESHDMGVLEMQDVLVQLIVDKTINFQGLENALHAARQPDPEG
jgi:hypothetical protein